MRPLIISDTFATKFGGVENHSRILAEKFKEHGYDVSSIQPHEFPSQAPKACDIIIVEGIHRSLLLKLYVNKRFSTIPKILFTHGSFFEIFHRNELLRTPYRFSRFFTAKKLFDRILLRRTLSTFIKVVALSGKEVGELVSNLHLDGERVTSLQNFYDEILDSKVEEKGSIGNEAFSLDTPYLCSISRIDRRKNFLSVLKAIKGLSVNFVLAGSDHGGLSELLDFARVNDITNFSYLGVISDEVKRRLISNSLATILPSYCEGFPLFVLESLSRGKVCITTESNYMENLDGIVLTGTDPDSIKASISTVISRNCPIPKVRLKSNEQTFLDLMGIIQSAMKWS